MPHSRRLVLAFALGLLLCALPALAAGPEQPVPNDAPGVLLSPVDDTGLSYTPVQPVEPDILDPDANMRFEAASCQDNFDCPCPNLCFCVTLNGQNFCLCRVECCVEPECP